MASNPETEGASTPSSSQEQACEAIMAVPNYSVPDWFFPDNVKTVAQLRTTEPKIFLADQRYKEDSDLPNYARDRDDAFVVCRQTFQSVRDTLASCLVPDANGQLPTVNIGAIISCRKTTGRRICAEYVDALAKEFGATLVTLTLHDLHALAASYEDQTPPALRHNFEDDLRNEISKNDSMNDVHPFHHLALGHFRNRYPPEASDKAKTRSKLAFAPIFNIQMRDTIDDCLETNASLSNDAAESTEPPLMMHIAEAELLLDMVQGMRIVAGLKDHVVEQRKAGKRILLVFTRSGGYWCHSSFRKLQKRGNIPRGATFTLKYVGVPAALETCPEPINMVSATLVNALKLALRYHARQHLDPEILRPKAEWNLELGQALGDFIESDDALMQAIGLQITGRALTKQKLGMEDLVQVLLQVSLGRSTEEFDYVKPQTKEDNEMEPADGQGEGAQGEDESEAESEHESEHDTDSDLETRKPIDERGLNKYEKGLLSSIITVDELQDTKFEHVILNDDMKAMIQQLLLLSKMKIDSKSPLLKSVVQISGALLYGPPGTGKTHLSRAIANSLGSNMLALDSASLQSKWVGETENYIKATFSLARKCSPCVIFLDEVDALFYRRASDDRSWQRAALTQFLQEMDGLRTGLPGAPFVLVATNRPRDLDTAFLRRLPQKLHFGLPEAPARAQILRMLLNVEDLAPDVSIDHLAILTEGYSGSDLKNLCAEAALLWVLELSQQTAKEDAERVAEKAAQEAQAEAEAGSMNAGDDVTDTAARTGHVASTSAVQADETAAVDAAEPKDAANDDAAATDGNAAQQPEHADPADTNTSSEATGNGATAGDAGPLKESDTEAIPEEASNTAAQEPDDKTQEQMDKEIKKKEKEIRKAAREEKRREREERKRAEALYQERLSKVCLTNALFEKALQKMRPTVSKEAIREIEKFAKLYSDN